MTTLHKVILRIVALLAMSFLVSACQGQGSSDAPATYERLCKIYREVVSQPITLGMKEGEIVGRVQKELPGLFNDNFYYITRENAGNRYADIKRLAKDKAGKSDWSCEVMKVYLKNEFSKPAKD